MVWLRNNAVSTLILVPQTSHLSTLSSRFPSLIPWPPSLNPPPSPLIPLHLSLIPQIKLAFTWTFYSSKLTENPSLASSVFPLSL